MNLRSRQAVFLRLFDCFRATLSAKLPKLEGKKSFIDFHVLEQLRAVLLPPWRALDSEV